MSGYANPGNFLLIGSATTDGRAERMMYMRLSQRIRVSVSRPDGGKEAVVKTARTSLRSRLLRRFVGDRYSVLVLTPVGMNVDAVEIRETRAPDTGPES